MTAPSQQDLIKLSYEAWYAHPTTQQFISSLRKHRERFAEKATSNAGNVEIPDAHIRHFVIGMRNMDFILKAITDYNTFLSLLNHESPI